jgi:hypothetical protein
MIFCFRFCCSFVSSGVPFVLHYSVYSQPIVNILFHPLFKMRFTAQLVGAFAVAAAAVPHVPRAILAYRSVRPP